MEVQLTEGARELIAREGYDPVYGARPLRRFIQREVETRIGRALLSGEIFDGATITLDAEGNELVVRWQNPGGKEPTEPEPRSRRSPSRSSQPALFGTQASRGRAGQGIAGLEQTGSGGGRSGSGRVRELDEPAAVCDAQRHALMKKAPFARDS